MTGPARSPGRLKSLWGQPRLRLLFWTTLLALIFGAIEFGAPLEGYLRVARNAARPQQASGDVVLVAIDDRSLARVSAWPWPRRYHGQMADRLRELGARRVLFDIDFSPKSGAAEDAAFDAALDRWKGKATLAARFVIDPVTGRRTDNFPTARLRDSANIANINFRYSPQGFVWEIPYALTYGGTDVPSLAAELAGIHGETGTSFPVDYAIEPASIPMVSAADLLAGKVPPGALTGKDVVIGTTSLQLGDIYFVPGHGRMSGVYLHMLAAETLKGGRPVEIGWYLPLLVALALAAASLFARRPRHGMALFSGGTALLLVGPLFLEERRLYAEVTPALFLLVVACATHGWQSFRRSYRDRSLTNPATGLPTLNALRESALEEGGILIAARVRNYPEICAALPGQEERALVEQIVSRLTLGTSVTTLYQGDDGIFAWTAGPDLESQLGGHLDALHALFRTPISVAGIRFDLSITFGVESGKRSAANRLGAALVAADEAAAESLRWKRYDAEKLRDAPWKLSILSQLDAAIEDGDLWVAFQPKYDIPSRAMIGAEALVRWTHPEKGPIAPMEFVPAAEQSGRIEKLTEFVLERAIRGAALINRRVREFTVSVNISPKLLGRFPLEAVVMDLLARHRLRPECLTLELTETAALTHDAADLGPLHNLRDRGVRISIDDYGTGLSTLEYVKRIPATEIKVDKSFVQGIGKSHSDKLMVNSTIQLAHSLGQKVVAEGVEDLPTLETLAAMGCDVGQGFYLAKPMTFKELLRLVAGSRRRRAA